MYYIKCQFKYFLQSGHCMDEANVLMNAGVFLGETSEARESLAIGVCEKQSGQPPQSQERSAIQFL